MSTDLLSETFAALADPTRRAILDRLRDGAVTVSELARPFPVTVQAVSRHVGVLEHAGLVVKDHAGTRRPSRLDAARLLDAAAWLAPYHHLWTPGFDRLAQRLDD